MASWSSIACACSAAILLTSCSSKPLPSFGAVPEFKLTAQTGREFNSATLKGSVWVVDFMFTNCAGPCPRMTAHMRKIATEFAGRSDLRFVSFTVDPARDSPEVLNAYAAKFHADPERWSFLTGPQPVLNHLGRHVFLLNDVDGSLDHNTRFVLVDRKGTIRGFYPTLDSKSIDRIVTDIKALLKEKA